MGDQLKIVAYIFVYINYLYVYVSNIYYVCLYAHTRERTYTDKHAHTNFPSHTTHPSTKAYNPALHCPRGVIQRFLGGGGRAK